MPYIRISSLILVFFILFSKASARINNSITIIEERGIEADANRLYETGKSKSIITKIALSIAFIFERIYTTIATFVILPNTWVRVSSITLLSAKVAFPEFEKHTPTFAVKVSALLKPTKSCLL